MALLVHTYLSPRIIEVLDPATDVTVQELVDEIRDWEDDNLSFKKLLSAAGKEALGGGVLVGITATLQNARLMFSARSTPLSPSETCSANDTTGRQLTASGADFIADGIYAGCTVYNYTTGAMATVTAIATEVLNHFPLTGGSRADWQIGDSVVVWPNVQCNITGGNLVAVDEAQAELDPVFQSPNVQVVRTSSSSATLQELAAIQYASYNEGVTVDVVNGVAGTVYPIGTPQQPVNNLVDALAILTERGFITLYIIEDITLDNAYEGLHFVGHSQIHPTIDIDASADVGHCEFSDIIVTGALDGGAYLKNCFIYDLTGLSGIVDRCILGTGTIVLGNNEETHFLDCWSGVVGLSTPVIDMGGSGQGLGIRNYNGGIKLINKSGVDKVSIDMGSGQVLLDSTVTNGEIVIRGLGHLDDQSVGANVNSTHFLEAHAIADHVWEHADAVFLVKMIKNKKALVKTGSIWELIIYDDDDATPILQKDLKDKDGSDITDLLAGVLAQELKTSV